jgi:hypothetical protein
MNEVEASRIRYQTVKVGSSRRSEIFGWDELMDDEEHIETATSNEASHGLPSRVAVTDNKVKAALLHNRRLSSSELTQTLTTRGGCYGC